MSKEFLISVSTMWKSDALDVILESLWRHGYFETSAIHVADDGFGLPYQVKRSENPNHPLILASDKDVIDMPSALGIVNKHRALGRDVKLSYGKERGGISINKNRGIYYFLNKTDCKYLLLLDDDQELVAPGLCEELKEVLDQNTSNDPITGRYSCSHVSLTWSDSSGGTFEDRFAGGTWADAQKTWFSQFPVEALGWRLEWRRGAMGVGQFASRPAVEAVLYYDRLGDSKYGYEHVLWSSRLYSLVDKRSPVLYGVYDASELYLRGQAIPNNYGGTVEEAQKADPIYQFRLNNEIAQGLKRKVKDPGFDPTEETILE